LEDDREAFEVRLLPQREQVRAELVLAAQLGGGLPPGDQLEDHLGLELGRERASCTSGHE
jgi:hypothetical protein